MAKATFWEDAQQALERLNGSYILYGDSPAYVEGVHNGREAPTATVRLYPDGVAVSRRLDDPLFHRYRKLPTMGWYNSIRNGQALYMERRPTRSRQHGLSSTNVRVGWLHAQNHQFHYSDYEFNQEARDPGYASACAGEYPSLEQVFAALRPDGVMAVSSKYAICRDNFGMRWLFRQNEKIGTFTDANSLMIAGNFAYLKEELAESSVLTVRNIQEF